MNNNNAFRLYQHCHKATNHPVECEAAMKIQQTDRKILSSWYRPMRNNKGNPSSCSRNKNTSLHQPIECIPHSNLTGNDNEYADPPCFKFNRMESSVIGPSLEDETVNFGKLDLHPKAKRRGGFRWAIDDEFSIVHIADMDKSNVATI